MLEGYDGNPDAKPYFEGSNQRGNNGPTLPGVRCCPVWAVVATVYDVATNPYLGKW